jgi:hypothetical protein
MPDKSVLEHAVDEFARLTHSLSEADLQRPWEWGSYDEEGVRFAFFRTYEELRDLAVRLADERAASGAPLSRTQRILAQYQAAYRDLQAILLGIIEAAQGFFFVIQYALERGRGTQNPPLALTDEGWDDFWAGDAFEQVQEDGSFADLLAYYAELHARVLGEFAAIRDAELETPSKYWEAERMSIAFRLQRFDSHMRQHSVQAEKTLVALGHGPTEARRLLRLVYNALAEAEGRLIGDWQLGAEDCRALADRISGRTAEIAVILVE